MGRRRRRVIRIVKKKLPTVFVCPKCGEEAVRVSIAKDTGKALVFCALCQLKDEFQAHPAAQMIDVYSYFTDRFYGVKDPRPIIPHERTPPARVLDKEEAPMEPVSPEPPSPETATPEMVTEPPSMTEAPGEPPVEAGPELPEASKALEEVPEPPAAGVSEETAPEAPIVEGELESKEEDEPFSDILQNKDKKRYSPRPIPQSSE